jgi:nitroreductase
MVAAPKEVFTRSEVAEHPIGSVIQNMLTSSLRNGEHCLTAVLLILNAQGIGTAWVTVR